MLRRSALVLVLLACGAAPLAAQPELVPAEHPVYAFLQAQRVAGHLPEYAHERRPLARGEVQEALDSLDTRRAALGVLGRRWLALYRQAFFEPPEAVEALVTDGRLRWPRGRDTEKFVYHRRDSLWRFAASAGGRLGYRAARDTLQLAGRSAAAEARFEGHYRGLIGFYTETFDGATSGDRFVLQRDPELRPLFYTQMHPEFGQFDRSTAALRVGGGRVYGEIAHARLLAGNTFGESLILSSDPDYFSFVRLGARTRRVAYTFVHATLGDRNRRGFSDLDSSGIIESGNARFFALHRVDVRATRALRFAFTEMVIYGRRGVELAYLNPVNPFKTSEHALYDRDNTLFALEATLAPVRGVEAYGSVLVDDFDFGNIGRHYFGNKWAIQAGVGAARGAAMAWAEYTRVEPFTYTHRFFKNGSFYNAYTHNGFGLGHPIGPNADQYEAGLRLWGPARLTLEARARYRRRGENHTDASGAFVNVGGDLGNGVVPDRNPDGTLRRGKYFLAGERFDGPGGLLALTWEPVRTAVRLRLYADAQRWSGRAPDEAFLRFEVRLGL
jgi:hypothetical protein